MHALKAFDFEQTPVRTIIFADTPWFVLADVCRILELDNPSYVAGRLDDDEKMTIANTLVNGKGIRARGNPNTNFINESGLYALIFTSRKEVARRFRKWVTSEVLPALRQTGTYSLDEDEERDWPVSADGKLWGVRVSKVNAAARMMSLVSRIYGPEAARELYSREPGLPDIRHKTIGAVVGTASDDPVGCLRHLMRQAAGKSVTIFARLDLAFADEVAAKALASECGVRALPKADGGPAVAIENAHAFLARVFADTQWCGAWRDALVNLDGAVQSRPLKATIVSRVIVNEIMNPKKPN